MELPKDSCREPVAAEDPAVEAAMQALSQEISVYLWGEDREPAVVHADISEGDVEVEEDER